MRNTVLYFLLSFGTLFISTQASALEAPVRGCNGCNYSQQKQLAQEFSEASRTRNVYIYDLQDSSVFLWEVNAERDIIPGETVYISYRYPAPSDVRKYFEFLAYVYYETAGSMDISLDKLLDLDSFGAGLAPMGAIDETSAFPATTTSGVNLPESAYDFVSSPAAQKRVSDYIRSPANIWVAPVNVTFNGVNLGLKIFRNDPALQLTITIKFLDGSTAKIQYDMEMNEFQPVQNSARDSSGNLIPEGPADFAGPSGHREYDFRGTFGGQDLIQFINRAVSLGIPITGSASNRRIGCVSANGVTTCESF